MAKRKKKAPAEPKEYSGEIELRLPLETLARLRKIAEWADVSVQTVIRVCLATEVLRAEGKTG